MSTFYAGFTNPNKAHSLVHQLLETGISNDDISIIIPESVAASWDDHILDSDPGNEALISSESPIGAGISTSSPDDDISLIEESDESQERAEDQSYERSQGQIEAIDLEGEIETGFPIDPPISRKMGYLTEDDAIDQIAVPGFAVVQGGGELATAALAPSPSDLFASIRGNLIEEGVDKETVDSLEGIFKGGGVILAVELSSGNGQGERLESLANSFDADISGSFGAPRYTALDGSEPQRG